MHIERTLYLILTDIVFHTLTPSLTTVLVGQAACKNKNCKDVGIATQMAILDGAHTKKEIKKNESLIKENNEEVEELEAQMTQLEEVNGLIHSCLLSTTLF